MDKEQRPTKSVVRKEQEAVALPPGKSTKTRGGIAYKKLSDFKDYERDTSKTAKATARVLKTTYNRLHGKKK